MALYICLLLTVIGFSVAIYFHQRSRQYFVLLSEGAKQFEALKTQLESANRKIENFIPACKALESDLYTARSSLLETSKQLAVRETESAEQKANYERKIKNIESQRDHVLSSLETLRANSQKLEVTLNESLTTKADFAAQVETIRAQLEDAKNLASSKLKTENGDLRRKLGQYEREVAELKARKEISPKDFETIKRRASHNEQLYRSMKGLRDLTDERNKNWEQALTHLATWILTKSSLARDNDPILREPVGPLVGEALERIGASLISTTPHEELMAERRELSFAD